MTWGEILDWIEVYNEKERRHKRDAGIMIYQGLNLLGKMFSPKAEIGKVYEEFPYFSQEELDEIPKARLRNYREIMEGYVKKSKHGVNNNGEIS